VLERAKGRRIARKDAEDAPFVPDADPAFHMRPRSGIILLQTSYDVVWQEFPKG